MTPQDIEITLEVLKERQRVQANHLKDVDECCGKIQGNTQSKILHINERIIAIEHDMDDNCKNVEIDLQKLQTISDQRCDTIKEIKTDIKDIHTTYKKTTTEIIILLITTLITLATTLIQYIH